VTEYGIFSVFLQADALGTITIDNKDLYRTSFNEDIYSYGSVGKLALHDKYGLKEYGPVTGDEKIVITYGKDAPIVKEFSLLRISKISGVKAFQPTKSSVLELHFTDTYFKNLVMKKYSKAWDEGTKASEIVKDILKNMVEISDKSMEIEPSETTLDTFYMPYWTPADTIRWISDRAKGTKGKCNYGYLLFPSSKKYLTYATLDNLLNNAESDPDTYIFETTDLNYDNKILSWQQTGVDQMGIRELGGGQLLGYNYEEKDIIGIEKDDSFVYTDAIKKITTLGKSSLFDGFTIDNKSDIFNYTYEVTGESDKEVIKNIFYNNFIRRYSLQNMVQLLMVGHNRRYAGQKVNIQWPSATNNDIYSSMDSGQYLIKSIMHTFDPLQTPFYLQTVTCIKNAYQSNKFNTTTPSDNFISSIFKLGIFG
jgi:hypothetical protein